MRKALLPMFASLALCGAATAALIATNARAEQSARKPVMTLVGQDLLAGDDTVAPVAEGGAPAMMHDDSAHRAQFCKDMYAHKVGEMAFLEAKLSLTASQQPLFDHWKQANLDIARRHESDCTGREATAHKPGERPSLVDRLNREETMLKRRLADIDAEKPSLTAFYASLSQQQQQEFGHAAMYRMAERMHMMRDMMGGPHRPGMGGPMGHGPGPMDGPGAMGDAPPPPPAQ
ncbi:MAG TPA: Spy/CpxP family protein refolding chaperone [Rhizomicrobium sp.]|nr:Spy/CpxP family protein refolding chaperone [Rhizomicrobium sp.]